MFTVVRARLFMTSSQATHGLGHKFRHSAPLGHEVREAQEHGYSVRVHGCSFILLSTVKLGLGSRRGHVFARHPL